jgi:hypothetical protein
MTLQECGTRESYRSVYSASQNVLEAVRTLLLRAEALEERALRDKMDETEMEGAELKALDKSLHEMREEGLKITLDEFNEHQGLSKDSRSEVRRSHP